MVQSQSSRHYYSSASGRRFRPRLELLEDRLLPATRIWTGLGADANWMTAANWQGNVAPAAGDDLGFPDGAIQLTNTNNFAGGTSFNSITLEGGPYTIAGNSVALGAGGISSNSGSQTLNLNLTLTGSQEYFIVSGGLTLGGVLSGNSAIVKGGDGSLVLSGANSYSGDTSIIQGSLRIQNNAALGSVAGPTSVIAGATLEISGGLTVAEPLTLAGTGISNQGALLNVAGANTWSGTVTLAGRTTDVGVLGGQLTVTGVMGGSSEFFDKLGNGPLILLGANTLRSGLTTIEEGSLTIGNNSALGSTSEVRVSAGASLQLQGNITVHTFLRLDGDGFSGGGALRSLSGTNFWTDIIQFLGSSSIGVDLGSQLTTSASIQTDSTETLKKVGSGRLILPNANISLAGPVDVRAGNLNIQDNAALGDAAVGTTVEALGALEVQGSGLSVAERLTLSGPGVAGTGALRCVGTGNAWSGQITLQSSAFLGAPVGSDLSIPAGVDGSGGLTKVGGGLLTLQGSNNYTGPTTVATGILKIIHWQGSGGPPWHFFALRACWLDGPMPKPRRRERPGKKPMIAWPLSLKSSTRIMPRPAASFGQNYCIKAPLRSRPRP